MSVPPIAWLGMYDHPRQHVANDMLWREIARRLRDEGLSDIPAHLAHGLSPDAAWSHPGLLLGQICVRPLRERFAHLRVLGHPDYAVCERPGHHRALLVARADAPPRFLAEFRGCRTAINDRGSNTGYRLVEELTGPLHVWAGEIVETGSHRASLLAIAEGRADLAGIDEVTFATVARYEPALTKGLRMVERSRQVRTPPFVTAADTSPDIVAALRRALAAALGKAERRSDLAALDFTGFGPTPDVAQDPGGTALCLADRECAAG